MLDAVLDALLSPAATYIYLVVIGGLVVLVILERAGVPLPPWLEWIGKIGDVLAAVLATVAVLGAALRWGESTDGEKAVSDHDSAPGDSGGDDEATPDDYEKPELGDDETTDDQNRPRDGDSWDRNYWLDPRGDGTDDE